MMTFSLEKNLHRCCFCHLWHNYLCNWSHQNNWISELCLANWTLPQPILLPCPGDQMPWQVCQHAYIRSTICKISGSIIFCKHEVYNGDTSEKFSSDSPACSFLFFLEYKSSYSLLWRPLLWYQFLDWFSFFFKHWTGIS